VVQQKDMSLVIVSNRLPVSVKKTDGKLEFYPSVGGLATGLASYTKRRGTVWIGWPGIPSDELTEADKARIARELRKHHCHPIFLTQAQLDEYYNGFSNSVLWPLFHDLPVKRHPKRWWEAFQAVNRQFADEALRLGPAGSTIWIHDYQLLLVPDLIRQARPTDTIGYFLHIPFPAAEALAGLSEAKTLLRGMLGADLVGFHTRGYSQNFLEACDRLLLSGHQQDFVQQDDRVIQVAEFPMGIDHGRFTRTVRQSKGGPFLKALRQRYRGQTVILTVDRLDPSKGLVERLTAYQQFLRAHPRRQGRIVMVMIVAPSRTDIREYQNLKRRLDKLLADITAEFATDSWQPVDFIFEAVPLDNVMQYYQIADIAFIAPLRDGMNLVAKEYLASRPSGSGVLILSETAGAAEELRDAIQVNPQQPDTLVRGLERALNAPKHELRRRTKQMQLHIKRFTVQAWASRFMEALQQPRQVKPRPTRTLTERQADSLRGAYHQAGKRLLLLDYDGVLREFVRDPSAARPSDEVRQLLQRLGSNPANDVVIVSGRSKRDLNDWLGDLPLALAAEHGAFFRRTGGKNWHRTSQADSAWYGRVKDLFTYYADATPGALVEQKDAALVWHYRGASPYYAHKHLVAIRRLLKPLLKRYGLIAKDGHKILEVHPADVSKGRVTLEWLIQDYDFILALGDDATDEDMFRALPGGAYSIKVGRGLTAARWRLKNVAEVIALLRTL